MQSNVISRSDIRKIDNKVTRFIYSLLFFCLDWLRDEEINENESMTILVQYKMPATIIYDRGSARYYPIESKERTLNLSDWKQLEKGGKLSIAQFKKLINRYLPECSIIDSYFKGKQGVEFEWPLDFKVSINRDIELKTIRVGFSPTQSILGILIKKPDWLGSNICKRAFRNRVVMYFKDKKLIVFEGEGATYIFNENGMQYTNIRDTAIARESIDLVKRIEHGTVYESWEQDIKKVF